MPLPCRRLRSLLPALAWLLLAGSSHSATPFADTLPSFNYNEYMEDGVLRKRLPDGSQLWAGWEAGPGQGVRLAVVKSRSDGLPDPAFGNGEGIVRTGAWWTGFEFAQRILVMDDGRILLAATVANRADIDLSCYFWDDCIRASYLAIFRFNADGTPDRSFASGHRLVVRFEGAGTYERFAPATVELEGGNRIAIFEYPGGPRLATVTESGTLQDGTARAIVIPPSRLNPSLALPAQFEPSNAAPVVLPDGATFYSGRETAARETEGGIAAIAKLVNGAPDASFGAAGIVRLPVWGAREFARQVLVQRSGHLLVAVTVFDPMDLPQCDETVCPSYLAIFRLGPDGSRDPAFGTDGRVLLRLPDESMMAGGEAATSKLRLVALPDGSTGLQLGAPVDAPIATLDAAGVPTGSIRTVAYQPNASGFHHAALDRYFFTAAETEFAVLPALGFRWVSSGFRVAPAGTARLGLFPVCRYYGNPLAGVNAHFLSANTSECAGLQEQPSRWILESDEVFRVGLPDRANGLCGSKQAPIHRLMDKSGSGQHYYTTDRFERDGLVAKGWIAEGWGPHGVAMCSATLP